MIINSIRVQRFRCIRDATLPCEELTVLVGANGSGKSAFLRALDIFYNANARISDDDFYGRETQQPMLITVTFQDLSPSERERFAKYVEANELVVEKEITWQSGRVVQRYFGMSLRNPEFAPFREAGNANERRAAYEALRTQQWQELPPYTRQDEAARALEDWEEQNQDRCVRMRDEGQFFGFKEVGEAHLERDTKFLLIPAVLDASEEASERKGMALKELLDLVVRSAVLQREDITAFRTEVSHRYRELMDPANLPELEEIKAALNRTLQNYAPNAGVDLPWKPQESIEIPAPTSDPRLIEDDFASTIDRAGHGLQRAFLLTLLQHLALAEAPVVETDDLAEGATGPKLILGIEEPELYLHPNRQRHVSRILLQLATGSVAGVAQRTQVVYGTHSPLFVGIDRGDSVRVLRKVESSDSEPQETRVSSTTMDDVNRALEQAGGDPAGSYSVESTRARLVAIMTPWMNEGFFARVVVLVEGEEDRALLIGAAAAQNIDFDSLEISVIPAGGKRSLDRPAAIFRGLDIPVYIMWDSDYGGQNAKAEDNHRLLRLCGRTVEDWPHIVDSNFACFERDFRSTVRGEIGPELWDELLIKWRDALDYVDNTSALKMPSVLEHVVVEATEKGARSNSLIQVLKQIGDLVH